MGAGIVVGVLKISLLDEISGAGGGGRCIGSTGAGGVSGAIMGCGWTGADCAAIAGMGCGAGGISGVAWTLLLGAAMTGVSVSLGSTGGRVGISPLLLPNGFTRDQKER